MVVQVRLFNFVCVKRYGILTAIKYALGLEPAPILYDDPMGFSLEQDPQNIFENTEEDSEEENPAVGELTSFTSILVSTY